MQPTLMRLLSSSLRRGPVWARWSLAAAMVLAATLLRICALGEHPGWPYLTYFPVIVLSSLFLANGSGYVAAVLSSVIAVWAFVPPVFSFVTLDDPIELVGFVLALTVNVLMAWLIEALRQLVTEQKVLNVKLADAAEIARRSEAEKTMLLEESAHRTRNDYQRLVGTIILQERLTRESDNAREALAAVRRRVEATAALHARLSQMTSHGRSLSVDSRQFITGVMDDLSNSFLLRPIAVITNAESHAMPMLQAVSLGLIINESVTNALKYAFPDDRGGRITASFRKDGNDFLLAIEDNGVGINPDAAPQGTGLGSKLVQSLAAQLQGQACWARSPTGGTTLKLRFPHHPPPRP